MTRAPRTEGLAPGVYGADELVVGDVITTEWRLVTPEMINAYAALSGDAFEIHMDVEAAARHGFDNRVAHGIMVLGLADGLKNRAMSQVKARASLGWELGFSAPVLAGDSIWATLTIAEMRQTSAGDQAVVKMKFDVRNQRDEVVLSGTNTLLAYR